jgi:hypothetical protein
MHRTIRGGKLMLARPTTDQIILDCRNELLNTIDPAIEAPQAKIAIQMMENVLRNCATRALHEIGWMQEEIDAMIAFADTVAAAPCSTPAVAAAVSAYAEGRLPSLHLAEITANYDLASQCLSVALEAAMAAGDDALHSAGRAILDVRLAHENEIMGVWTFVGRAE